MGNGRRPRERRERVRFRAARRHHIVIVGCGFDEMNSQMSAEEIVRSYTFFEGARPNCALKPLQCKRVGTYRASGQEHMRYSAGCYLQVVDSKLTNVKDWNKKQNIMFVFVDVPWARHLSRPEISQKFLRASSNLPRPAAKTGGGGRGFPAARQGDQGSRGAVGEPSGSRLSARRSPSYRPLDPIQGPLPSSSDPTRCPTNRSPADHIPGHPTPARTRTDLTFPGTLLVLPPRIRA